MGCFCLFIFSKLFEIKIYGVLSSHRGSLVIFLLYDKSVQKVFVKKVRYLD